MPILVDGRVRWQEKCLQDKATLRVDTMSVIRDVRDRTEYHSLSEAAAFVGKVK